MTEFQRQKSTDQRFCGLGLFPLESQRGWEDLSGTFEINGFLSVIRLDTLFHEDSDSKSRRKGKKVIKLCSLLAVRLQFFSNRVVDE